MSRLAAYDTDKPSQEAADTFNRKGRPRYSLEEIPKRTDPYYEDETDWPVSSGDVIIGYHKKGRHLRLEGFWKVRDNDPFIQVRQERAQKSSSRNQWRLILVTEIDHYEGLRFPTNERNLLGQRLEAYCEKQHWELDRYENFFDLPLYEAWRKLKQ